MRPKGTTLPELEVCMTSLIPAVGKAAAQAVGNTQQQAPARDVANQPHALQPAAISQAAALRSDKSLSNQTAPQVPKRVERTFESSKEKKKEDGTEDDVEKLDDDPDPPRTPGKGKLRAVA